MDDTLALLDLRVAPGHEEPNTQRLRLTFGYLGDTRWLHGWTGDTDAAERFIDNFVEAAVQEVAWERREFGYTDWERT